eukprot:g2307.t1
MPWLRVDDRVPRGQIWLSEITRKNIEVCTESTFLFSIYPANKDPILSQIVLDIRPRRPQTAKLLADGRLVSKHLHDMLRDRIVTRDEIFVFQIPKSDETSEFIDCVAYVADIEVPFDADEDARRITMYETLRGLVRARTQIFVRKDANALSANAQFVLENAAVPEEREKPRHTMELCTTDDETVPVKKALMRPCIKLASVVLEGHGIHSLQRKDVPSVDVPMDCCTLDRVLLYLEWELTAAAATSAVSSSFLPSSAASTKTSSVASDERSVFEVELDEAEELLKASRDLGCRGLEDLCLKKLGEFKSRVRPEGIPWDEVSRRNRDRKEILICLDGMIFDVTRWMPQHPGGASIIPKQALNMDAARMFEIYHVGSEPFNYLKQFYIGDVLPSDAKRVPKTATPPSEAFLSHLASYTSWRVRPTEKDHVSF